MNSPIVIYRLGSIGDTVVALPCFHSIARAFPDHSRLVLTNMPVSSKAAPLELVLGPSGLIDGVIDYPVGTRSPARLADLAGKLRMTDSKTLVYLAAPRGRLALLRDLAFFRFCGFRTIIGAPSSPDLQRGRADGTPDTVEPEAERLARSIVALGPIDLADRSNWDLKLTADEFAVADRALAPFEGQPFVTINIGGKARCNDWGQDNWQALIEKIAPNLRGVALAAVGGAEDFARSRDLIAHWPGRSGNFCGTLQPRESAALLSRARLFIGHDSGPMHLAAGVGTPSLGLFGQNNKPRMWHPYGSGHRALHDMRGVQSIAVDDVYRAALSLLNGAA